MDYIYKQFQDQDVTIRGVINVDDDFDESQKHPAIIVFHGFGSDRNGQKGFRIQLAKYFAEKGYVVPRFDFFGSGESGGDFYEMTVTRELEEAVKIYDLTARLPYVDPDEIYVIGHSLGGVVGPLLTQHRDVKKLALMAPANGLTEPKNIKDALNLEEELSSYEELEQYLPDDSITFDDRRIDKNFIKDVMSYDLYALARGYDRPVFIIRGDEDDMVKREDNEKFKDAFPQGEYVELEDSDHSFLNVEKRPDLFEQLYNFISK